MPKQAQSGRARVRRGWTAMSGEEKQRWREKKTMDAKELTDCVTSAIVDLIARSATELDLGWKDPWVPPQHINYGRRYTGVNALALAAQARERGQRDCRFLTLRALARLRDAAGGRAVLKEGARPYLVMQPRQSRDRRLDPGASLAGYEQDRLEQRADGWWLKGRVCFSTVRVYSIADTTAVAPPLMSGPGLDFRENLFFERVFEAFGVHIVHKEGMGACYSRSQDTIYLPPREHFNSVDACYATLLHEFYHWTGHRTRENRVRECMTPQSEDYAREELRAELFSAVTSVMFGLRDTLPKAAGYIGKWNATLQDNPREVFIVASQVQNMASALYDLADGQEPRLNWARGLDFSRVPTPVAEARREGRDLESSWRRAMGIEEWGPDGDAGTLTTRSLPASGRGRSGHGAAPDMTPRP